MIERTTEKVLEVLSGMYPDWMGSRDIARLSGLSPKQVGNAIDSYKTRHGLEERSSGTGLKKKEYRLMRTPNAADQTKPEPDRTESECITDWLAVGQNLFTSLSKILVEDYPRAMASMEREQATKEELKAAQIQLDGLYGMREKYDAIQKELQAERVKSASAEETVRDRDATIANLVDELQHYRRNYGNPLHTTKRMKAY